MADPRGSTDEESAPLLNHDNDDGSQGFFSALLHPTRALTNLEKLLGVFAVVLLLLASTFIGLFAGAQNGLNKERSKHGDGGWQTETLTATKTSIATTTISAIPTGKPQAQLCLSEECVTLASSIMQSLNTSMDPCEDFYEYATGGWSASHDIPADRGLLGAFNEVADNNKRIILRILNAIPSESKIAPTPDESNLRKLKAVYTSCMDVDKLTDIGIKPLIPMADFVMDNFGPFDLIPAPKMDIVVDIVDWRGAYTEDFVVSDKLIASAERYDTLRQAKVTAGTVWERPAREQMVSLLEADDLAIIDNNSDRTKKITQTLAWLHSRGVEALVSFAVEGDAGGEDSQIQSLWLYQASGGLPSKEYYEEKPILDLYQSVVQGILVDIATHTKVSSDLEWKRDIADDLMSFLEDDAAQGGWPWPWPGGDQDDHRGRPPTAPQRPEETIEQRMEKLAAKVVHFERELVRAGADPEYLFNPRFSYNPYLVEKVDKALPFLDLATYLSTFAPRSFPINITVTHPPYLKSVSKLVSETPDYVLSGYFNTRLAMTYAEALGPKVGVRQEFRRLKEVLRGVKKGTEENRQDVCLTWVDEVIGYIAGREFVREAFSPEAKADGESIIKSIVEAFHDKLPHISWMDAESAEAAQKKAEALIPKVGYPLFPNIEDATNLAAWYARLDIKDDDFFGNVLRSTVVDGARSWIYLGRQRDRRSWDMYPQTVNAYYSTCPPDGEIVFPAGILQPPFYAQAWPSNMKYAAFGAVAAHELTHAFDNTGSQYDDKGRLRDWWTNSTVDAFQERAACVAKQYSKYYVYDDEGKKVYVNGNLTNGEDIADSGLAQAYSAWKNSLQSNSAPIALPGLEYSEEQLFFIAFARIWAQKIRPATAVSRVRTDPHSPPYWRATGTLRNLQAFSDAFGCKVGTGMHPPKEDRCELW